MGPIHCSDLAAVQGSCTLGWVTPPNNFIQIYKDLVPLDSNTEDTPTPNMYIYAYSSHSLGIVSTVAGVGGLAVGL